MNDLIDISMYPKPAVLAALYNASQPLGLGFLQATPKDMTLKEAAAELERYTYFDYLKGRVMKVDLKTDMLDPWGYDRDNGPGAAQRAIDTIPTT